MAKATSDDPLAFLEPILTDGWECEDWTRNRFGAFILEFRREFPPHIYQTIEGYHRLMPRVAYFSVEWIPSETTEAVVAEQIKAHMDRIAFLSGAKGGRA
jgi:hypothetical protein